MQFQAKVIVQGMKRAKGDFDGTVYDSTKFYIDTDLDDRSGNAWGKATTEYSLGTSETAEKYKHLPFPFEAVVTFSQVTTGKVVKIVLDDLKPVAAAAKA